MVLIRLAQLWLPLRFLMVMTAAINTAVTHSLEQQLKKDLPFAQKAMARMFAIRESASGASHAVFAQDAGTVWLPKVLVSRSWAERFECSFTEFVESAFFYYMVPFSAGKWFQKLFRQVAPGNVTLAELMKPVAALTRAERNRILPVKAACLLSSFGIVTIGGEYALNFVKNLLTQGFFKKSQFADVVNLRSSQHPERAENIPQRTAVTEQALKRVIQCWALCGAMFAGSMWLAKNGGKSDKLVNALHEVMQKYDFKYDLKNKKFGLALPHFQAMLPIAVLGYIDAARDRLEFVETGIRASATAFFLGWGSPMLEAWAVKKFGHKTPGLMQGKDVKTLSALFADSVAHAEKTVTSGNKAERLKAAKAYLTPLLARKSQLFVIPVGTGMVVVGLFVALMNQFWTRFRFKAIQKEEHDFIHRYTMANPHGVRQHWQDIAGVSKTHK